MKVRAPASQDLSSDPNHVACCRHLSHSALSALSFCFLISCGHGAPSESLPGTVLPTCHGLGWPLGHPELNQSRHREVTCKEKSVLRWITQILQTTICLKAKKPTNTPGEYLTWWLPAMSRISQQTGRCDELAGAAPSRVGVRPCRLTGSRRQTDPEEKPAQARKPHIGQLLDP